MFGYLSPFIKAFIFCLVLIHNCKSQIKFYDLNKPVVILQLPDTLREISDVTLIDSATVACVQDENGIIFTYDLIKNKITQQTNFGPNGDYEGIALAGKWMYVLRSDGNLFETLNYKSQSPSVNYFQTGIPATDNEGLCFDGDKNRLLIGCKNKIGTGEYFKDERFVYAFDLSTKKTIARPAFTFNIEALKKFALQKKIKLPVKYTKQGAFRGYQLKFTTSAIAIHPLTKTLYLISSTDRLLFEFDMKGTALDVVQLNTELCNKTEGITFLPNGDMIITNEGEEKKATLLKFKYMGN